VLGTTLVQAKPKVFRYIPPKERVEPPPPNYRENYVQRKDRGGLLSAVCGVLDPRRPTIFETDVMLSRASRLRQRRQLPVDAAISKPAFRRRIKVQNFTGTYVRDVFVVTFTSGQAENMCDYSLHNIASRDAKSAISSRPQICK